LFILKIKFVQGIGTILLIFSGFARTLFFPITICIFAAYFCKFYGVPNDGNILQDSGFSALPL